MSRAGMSEQDTHVLNYLQSSCEYFTVKEVATKLAKTNKKLREEVVEGILTMLVDDRLVQKEKVGTLNIIWSFPRDAERAAHARLQTLRDKRAAERAKQANLAGRLIEGQKQQEHAKEQAVLLKAVEKVKARVIGKRARVQALKSAAPVDVHEQVRAAKKAQVAINRWVDNVYSLESYFKNCGFGTTEEFYQSMDMAGPPEYLD